MRSSAALLSFVFFVLASLALIFTTAYMLMDPAAPDFRNWLWFGLDQPAGIPIGYWIAIVSAVALVVTRIAAGMAGRGKAPDWLQRLALLGVVAAAITAGYFSYLLMDEKSQDMGVEAYAVAQGVANGLSEEEALTAFENGEAALTCEIPREPCTTNPLGNQCAQVNNLDESMLLGMPVSVLGIAGYLAMALAGLLLLLMGQERRRQAGLPLAGLLILFIAMSIYLMVVLTHYDMSCARCYMMHASHGVMILALLAALFEVVGPSLAAIGKRATWTGVALVLLLIPPVAGVAAVGGGMAVLGSQISSVESFCTNCINYTEHDREFDCASCCQQSSLRTPECDAFDVATCEPKTVTVDCDPSVQTALSVTQPPEAVRDAVACGHVFDFETEKVPVIGSSAMGIRFTVFEDLHCPSCAQLHRQLKDLYYEYRGGFEIVMKHFPMDANCHHGLTFTSHENACYSHRSAWALTFLENMVAFEAFVDAVYLDDQEKNPALIDEILFEQPNDLINAFGVDREAFESARDSAAAEAAIMADTREGRGLYLNGESVILGTPALFVNGVYVDISSITRNQLRQIIEALRQDQS